MFRKLCVVAAMAAALSVPATDALAWVAHGGGRGVHGGYGGRGYYGGRGVRGGYVGRGYYGGGGRYWGGRYWGYGVGPCWRVTPYGGFVWVCY